jgi:hypothetical protein
MLSRNIPETPENAHAELAQRTDGNNLFYSNPPNVFSGPVEFQSTTFDPIQAKITRLPHTYTDCQTDRVRVFLAAWWKEGGKPPAHRSD